MSLPSFSIQRHVFTLMGSLELVLFGIIGLARLGLDKFPKIEFPAITVVSFGAGLAEPDLTLGAGMEILSANSFGSPVWVASVITGTSPAHDTRCSSSKTADPAANLWDTFTGSAFLNWPD